MTLDDMVRLAREHATRVMVGTKEELVPSWLVITGKGAIEIFATPWGNNREKHIVIETMRDIMREKSATSYSMVTEAWMLHVQGVGVTEENYKGPMPSESPDRQECVVIMAANKDGEHRYETLETVRGDKGKCVELRLLSKIEDRFTGIFDNLLNSKKRAS
jgi:hypothetical protein